MASRTGIEEECSAHDPLNDYPGPHDRAEAQGHLRYGQMAVVIHQGEDWPSGRLCRNCHMPWPCRVYRWGLRVLLAVEWSAEDIAHMVTGAEAGDVPWR